MNSQNVVSALVALTVLVLAGCDMPYDRERPLVGQHLNTAPKDLANLSENDFLMRKATLGSRTERLEAIEVIERSHDSALFMFLIERLKVEDDRFIQIRIMHAMSDYGDVRAVPVLRRIARWDESRVGMEAIAALYDLGDDTLMPRLIDRLKPNPDFPEYATMAHQTLMKMTGENLPATIRAWKVYYETHRLAPWESKAWYWPFEVAPLPKTVAGTDQIEPKLRGKPQMPDHDIRCRKNNVQFGEFWRNEAP